MKHPVLAATLFVSLVALVGCAGPVEDTDAVATESAVVNAVTPQSPSITLDCPSNVAGAERLTVIVDRVAMTVRASIGERVAAATAAGKGFHAMGAFTFSQHANADGSYSVAVDAESTEVFRVTKRSAVKLAFEGHRSFFGGPDSAVTLTSIEVGSALEGGGFKEVFQPAHLTAFEGATCNVVGVQ